MSAQAQPLLGWFSGSFSHKWGSLKSAYATVIGKVTQQLVGGSTPSRNGLHSSMHGLSELGHEEEETCRGGQPADLGG